MQTRPRRSALLAVLIGTIGVGVMSGCATSRGTLDVRIPNDQNPQQGVPVKITRVSDLRVFELSPSDPSTPSLKNGEIENKEITSRAIARKRNTYGQALGDILLPEGRTVEQLAREVVTRGLRMGGLRVLSDGDPGHDAATPLEVDIQQFWAWISPGFWAAHIEFDSLVRVTGDLEPFEDGKSFKGYIRLGTQAATTGAWLNTLNKGLDDLARNMALEIRAESQPTRSFSKSLHRGGSAP